MARLDHDYGQLIDEIARCTAKTPVDDGISAADTLQQLRGVRRRITDFRRQHDELPAEYRARLEAAVTTIDHLCDELQRLKRTAELLW
jgi:hypothetical protein